MANYKSRNGRRKGAADALPAGGKAMSLDKGANKPSYLTGQVVNVGGIPINKKLQPLRYLIYLGLSKKNISLSNNTNTNVAATILLGALDCVVSEGELDFLTDTNDIMMKNPNIEDNLKGKKGAPVLATDKFVDVDNPFYNLDQAMSRPTEREHQKEKNEDANNYIKLAGDMVRAMASTAGTAPQHQTSAPIQQKHREKEKQESRTSAPIQQKYREK